MIELFDREFVETQEALGMTIIGQFRDLDNPDRFVWLRGFSDMPARGQALSDFYGGPVWQKHRDAANATMVDSSNALLLRPAYSTSGFSLTINDRSRQDAGELTGGLIVANLYSFSSPVDTVFLDFFAESVEPVLTEAGATVLASFVTEYSENTFPKLPVREGEHLFVWFAVFSDQAAYERHLATLAQSKSWIDEVSEDLTRCLKGTPEVLKLLPTSRSLLRS